MSSHGGTNAQSSVSSAMGQGGLIGNSCILPLDVPGTLEANSACAHFSLLKQGQSQARMVISPFSNRR